MYIILNVSYKLTSLLSNYPRWCRSLKNSHVQALLFATVFLLLQRIWRTEIIIIHNVFKTPETNSLCESLLKSKSNTCENFFSRCSAKDGIVLWKWWLRTFFAELFILLQRAISHLVDEPRKSLWDVFNLFFNKHSESESVSRILKIPWLFFCAWIRTLLPRRHLCLQISFLRLHLTSSRGLKVCRRCLSFESGGPHLSFGCINPIKSYINRLV